MAIVSGKSSQLIAKVVRLTSSTISVRMPEGHVKRFGWARARDAYAIYLAARDPRVPWDAKALAFLVAAYVLSPIDLIPDFIPIFGYGDDLIVVALGTLAVAQLVPPDIMAEHRATAAKVLEAR